VQVSPEVGGEVLINETTADSFPISLTFSTGSVVELEAVAGLGYEFNSWTGSVTGGENPVTLNIDCTKSVTAVFTQVMRTLTIEKQGSGSPVPAIGAHQYPEGTEISVTAKPDSGWQFDSWIGDVTDANSATTSIVVDTDKTISAVFVPLQYVLNIDKSGSGTTSPSVGTHSYDIGGTADVTATPDAGWKFDGWSGAVDENDSATVSVTMNSNKSITAMFSPIMHILTLNVVGNGNTSLETGEHEYAEGTLIEMPADPDDGWKFHHWEIDGTSSELATVSVLVDGDKAVTVYFTRESMLWWTIGGIAGGAVIIGLLMWYFLRWRMYR